MASIPKISIKKLIKKYVKFNITNDGAQEIARMLEREAKEISNFAVQNAKKEKRDKITKKDITDYTMRQGFD